MNAIKDILKNFRSGVDFTESEGKIIFHNEELANHLIQQSGGTEKFFEVIKELIPSAVCSYEENGRSCAFVFKTGNNKKDRKQEIERQKVEDKKEVIDTDQQNRENDWKDWDTEWEKTKALWRKQEAETGISFNEKHYWRSWNNDGSIGTEGMYIKSESQSQLITFENKTNSSQVQEISDKETKQIKTETSSTSDKKDQADEKAQQQNSLQKTDNKDNNKNIYYGIGAISLVVLVISMMIVWVKKRKA